MTSDLYRKLKLTFLYVIIILLLRELLKCLIDPKSLKEFVKTSSPDFDVDDKVIFYIKEASLTWFQLT